MLLGGAARIFFVLRRGPRIEEAGSTSFLLVRPEGMGDIILTLPAVAFLRERHPAAHIAMAVRPMFADFVRDAAIVDEVVSLDYPKKSTFSLRELPRFVRQVWGLRGRFDVAYDFRGDPRNAILGAWSSRVVVGMPASETRFLLSAVYAKNGIRPEAERILEIVGLSEGSVPSHEQYSYGYRFAIPEVAGRKAEELLGGGRDVVVIHPGASRPSKLWKPQHWREFIRRSLSKGKMVVVTGAGAEEAAQVREALEGLEEGGKLVNLVNRTSGMQLAAVVERAGAVVSLDTGIAHIAFALGVPSVTLFGPDNEIRFGHRSATGLPVSVQLRCRPCEAYRCPRRDVPMECMNLITVDAVEAALEAVLSSAQEKDAMDPREVQGVTISGSGENA